MGVPTRVSRARPHGRRWKSDRRPRGWHCYSVFVGRRCGSSGHRNIADGRQVVGPAAGYAWTRSLLHERAEKGRIVLSEVDTTDTEATRAAAKDASLLWRESPSNPLIEITELDRILPTLRSEQVKVAVDSTFATPLLQQPLTMGADFSIQSATKFIGGHSDLMLGLVSTPRQRRRGED